jgi:hypothetical protein
MNFGNGSGMPVYSTDGGESWNQDTLGAPGHALGWGGLPAVHDIYAWGHWLFVNWDGPRYYDIKTFDGPYVRNTFMTLGGNGPHSVIAKGDTLFVSSSKLYYTVDGGANWTIPANNGYPGEGLILVDGSRLYVFASKVFGKPCGLFYSDNNGENWTEIDISSVMSRRIVNGDLYFPNAAFIRGNRIEFVATQEKYNTPPNVWKSTDLGATWSPDTAGLPTTYVTGGVNFAYTDDGTLWCVPIYENIYRQKIDAGGSAGTGLTHEMPGLLLEQNRPNPFNPSTTIDYQLPVREHVTLTMLDLQGRIVATLVDGVEDAGNRSARWDAEGVAGGVYLCRLQAGGTVVTRQVVLIR